MIFIISAAIVSNFIGGTVIDEIPISGQLKLKWVLLVRANLTIKHLKQLLMSMEAVNIIILERDIVYIK